jgi:DNA-binding MarR family transcriptional regulator
MVRNHKGKTSQKKPNKPLGIGTRGRRKLTNEQVLSIVNRYDCGGISQAALSREYQVTPATISAILRGLSYVWLTRIGFDAEVNPILQAA